MKMGNKIVGSLFCLLAVILTIIILLFPVENPMVYLSLIILIGFFGIIIVFSKEKGVG